MSTAHENIAERCEFCAHYESLMQAAQSSEKQALVLLRAVEHQLELERQSMNKQQNYVTELESNLQSVSEQTTQQVRLTILLTQPSIPAGYVNQVLACLAGVKACWIAGMIPCGQ